MAAQQARVETAEAAELSRDQPRRKSSQPARARADSGAEAASVPLSTPPPLPRVKAGREEAPCASAGRGAAVAGPRAQATKARAFRLKGAQ